MRSPLCVVAVAVFLRSFIAPGFMIKASAEDGLAIIFCDGPVSMVVSQYEHSGHQHHGDDAAQKEIHISPICGQWSFYASAGIPVVNDQNGLQSEPDFRVIGGFSFTF